MNEQQKAQAYGMLLNEHTRLYNQINEIKGQNLEPTGEDRKRIIFLENQQKEIMRKINLLLTR